MTTIYPLSLYYGNHPVVIKKRRPPEENPANSVANKTRSIKSRLIGKKRRSCQVLYQRSEFQRWLCPLTHVPLPCGSPPFLPVCLGATHMWRDFCAFITSSFELYRTKALPWGRFRWNVIRGPCCMQRVRRVEPSIWAQRQGVASLSCCCRQSWPGGGGAWVPQAKIPPQSVTHLRCEVLQDETVGDSP